MGRGSGLAVSVAVGLIALSSALAAPAQGATLERGFGATRPETCTNYNCNRDYLQIAVNNGSGFLHTSSPNVSDYLDDMNASWIHVSVEWCSLQNAPGNWNMSRYTWLRNIVSRARAEGKNTLITVDPNPPLAYAAPAMQYHFVGGVLTQIGPTTYQGCDNPSYHNEDYPSGQVAADFSSAPNAKTTLTNFSKTITVLGKCIRGIGFTDAQGDSCPTGSDLNASPGPYVDVQIGAESNNSANWQNGLCPVDSPDNGSAWYSSGNGANQHDCSDPGSSFNPDAIGRVRNLDADGLFDLANYSVSQMPAAATLTTILDGPWFRSTNAINNQIVDGSTYFARMLAHTNNGWGTDDSGDPYEPAGYDIDEASMQFGRCKGDDTNYPNNYWLRWTDAQCSASGGNNGGVKGYLDDVRTQLSSNNPSLNIPIAITGIFERSDVTNGAALQSLYGLQIYDNIRDDGYCSGARPVNLFMWSWIVGTRGNDGNIGVMNDALWDPMTSSQPPFDDGYQTKQIYDDMNTDSNLTCSG